MLTCLSKQTIAQLSRHTQSTSIPITVQYNDVTVAVCLHPSLPDGVLLPAGLETRKDANASVADLLSAESVLAVSNVIALRYAVRLFLSPSSIQAFIQDLRQSKLVSVNSKLLTDGKTLADLVTDSTISEPVELSVFKQNNAENQGLVCSSGVNSLDGSFVPVDTLLYCNPSTNRLQLQTILADTLSRTLHAIFNVSPTGDVAISHHPVFGSALCLTRIVSNAEEELSGKATEHRRNIHDAFCLPTNKPLLKWAYRLHAATSFTDGGYLGRLRDVHIGIKSHGLGDSGISVHVVQGHYLYCHYLQDQFGDSGWGCAYRSLQTIFSWCAMEKYCTFPNGILPTHTEIQKALVDIGDKPPSFVSSKEWIGANEVCYALERLTGINSKILHVSRGAEMESKGRELARHFDEQGSPVMVGGGVLAWTILGVARNSRTGKTSFLILDPHYEGRDELKLIQSKGWVGWKSADIFNPNAFYNLCMPQRPSGV